jgi:hypothetical protein
MRLLVLDGEGQAARALAERGSAPGADGERIGRPKAERTDPMIVAWARGRDRAAHRRIATADFPAAARRPANARLDNAKRARVFGLEPPAQRESLQPVASRLSAGVQT